MSYIDEPFQPLEIAVMTVVNSMKSREKSGRDTLLAALKQSDHILTEDILVEDNIYQIRSELSQLIASEHVQVVLLNGGTGFTCADYVPEAIIPLFDKVVDGFGELFRQLSLERLGSSTIQSRALAGFANRTVVFAMPLSPDCCQLAWDEIIRDQLDNTHHQGSFVDQLKSIRVQLCEGRR